jgi:hypothetical protein
MLHCSTDAAQLSVCDHVSLRRNGLLLPQNVPPEKIFTRERGVQQLLGIMARTTVADTGKYLAWDGQEIPW